MSIQAVSSEIPFGELAKRAVIYLRVSTLKQAQTNEGDGYSLAAQKEACVRKAAELGADIVQIYMDRGESAKSAERPDFQRMLKRIGELRDVDYVIVDKIDRFARNRRDDANLLFELQSAGAQLVSVKENIDETASGQLLHAVMAGIAEFYSKNLAAETMKGMTQKAAQGGTSGRAPIGYLNTRRRGEDGREYRTVAIDPDRAPLIQWAFEAYATGEWTVLRLADALTAKGLRALPMRGKTPDRVQPSHVNAILRNPYYSGTVRFRGAEYEGRHQPLITEALFTRVQDIIDQHYRAGEKERLIPHYLKGTVYCSECGYRLCITNAKGRYMYYYCLGRHSRRTTCHQPYMSVEQVEQAVERYYAVMVMPETMAEQIRTGLRLELEAQHRRAQPEIDYAARRVTELEAERRRLARGVVNGSIPEDLAADEQARIATELRQAKAVATVAEDIYTRIEQTLTTALTYVTRVQEAYRIGKPTSGAWPTNASSRSS
jgi:site-specific DNA recombinase